MNQIPTTAPAPTRQVFEMPGRPFLGVLPEMARDPLGLLQRAARAGGGLARVQLGPRQTYLVTHPDYVQHVLADHYRNYVRGDTIAPARLLLGDGVALIDGDRWLRERRLMQPAFHKTRLALLSAPMSGTVAAVLDGWRAYARSGRPLDVAAEMTRLALTLIVQTMFSADLGGQLAGLERDFNRAQAFIIQRANSPYALPLWIPMPAHRGFRAARRRLDASVAAMIASARQDPRDDLLGMLLRARDEATGEGLSDAQARDEVMTIFFAGHETTATALAWTWYLIGAHPEVEARLRDELAAALGGRAPAYADLAGLPYMLQVLQESMRLYPPNWMLARRAVASDEICGYPIPAGAFILISAYVTHRDPDLWPDPERFDPERFTAERSARRHRFAYYPFGGGPHQCIGNNFALMEAQLVLALALQRYRLRPAPGHPVTPRPQIALRPGGGVWMTVEEV